MDMNINTMDPKVKKGEATEDRFTATIEKGTSQVPSSAYLGAAIAFMGVSATLKFIGRDNWALFVGQWPAAFLIMGIYNKMVKQHGSDANSQNRWAA